MNIRTLKKEIKKSVSNSIGIAFNEMGYKPIIKQTNKTVIVTHYFTNLLSIVCKHEIKTGDLYFFLIESDVKIFGIRSEINKSNFSSNCNIPSINKMVKSTIQSLLIFTIDNKQDYIDKQIKSYNRKHKIKNLLCNSHSE